MVYSFLTCVTVVPAAPLSNRNSASQCVWECVRTQLLGSIISGGVHVDPSRVGQLGSTMSGVRQLQQHIGQLSIVSGPTGSSNDATR